MQSITYTNSNPLRLNTEDVAIAKSVNDDRLDSFDTPKSNNVDKKNEKKVANIMINGLLAKKRLNSKDQSSLLIGGQKSMTRKERIASFKRTKTLSLEQDVDPLGDDSLNRMIRQKTRVESMKMTLTKENQKLVD